MNHFQSNVNGDCVFGMQIKEMIIEITYLALFSLDILCFVMIFDFSVELIDRCSRIGHQEKEYLSFSTPPSITFFIYGFIDPFYELELQQQQVCQLTESHTAS